MFLARFWAFICILFLAGDSLIWLLNIFYKLFIRGKSKAIWRGLIEKTVGSIEVFSVNHKVFASAGAIAIIFHVLIVRYMGKISAVGIAVLIVYCFSFVLGIIYKYIYHKNNMEKNHKIAAAVMWILIIIHIALC